MLRRLLATVVPVLLLLGSTGCEDPRPVTVRPPIAWTTPPTTDTERRAVLAAARAIDPCALIPRATLDALGTVQTVDATAPDSCVAELNSTDLGKQTRLAWTVLVAPSPSDPYPGGVERTIGDATVLADRDTEPEPDVVVRSCAARARFPVTIGLFVHAATPITDLPCALLDRVLPGALELLRTQPAIGTSPDTPKTALAVADPCAVLSELGVTTPLDRQLLHRCVFDYQGTKVDLQYQYDYKGMVAKGDPILVVNGHPGHDLRSPTENSWYGAILGPPLTPPGNPSPLGPRVPVVKLMGRDPTVLREVLSHTAELFPED
ncbi:hypothetical protein [Nocardia sp. MW-W600-9]